MELRVLGGTGVRVGALSFGAMGLGSWANADHDDGVRIIHAALDAGINLIDTADAYSAGDSEVVVGKAVAGRRDRVIVATKGYNPMGNGPNMRGNSRLWLTAAVEHSLRRLNLDHIDLYQVHRPDPDTDIEETLGVLTDLQRAGKIRYFGCSTFRPHKIVQAQWASREHNLGRFVTEQPPYSLLARGIEADVLPVCRDYRMGVISWSPLAGGWLSGNFSLDPATKVAARKNREARMPSRFDPTLPANIRKWEVVQKLAGLAEEAGVGLPHMAVAFAIRHPAVTTALIGPRTLEQLTGLIGAAEVVLSHELLDRIDEIVPPGVTVNPADAGWLDNGQFADVRATRRP